MKKIPLFMYYIENKIVDIYNSYFSFKKNNSLIYKNRKNTIKNINSKFEGDFILLLHKNLFHEEDKKLKIFTEKFSSCSFVLYEKDILIGYVVCRLVNFFFYKRAWIYSLGIIPEYQGRKKGYFLLNHVLKWLQKEDYKHILLLVNSDNSARFLYKKCGFYEKLRYSNNEKVLMENKKILSRF